MPGLGHIAVGVAAGRLQAGAASSRRRLAAAMGGFAAVSLLPDADVLAFTFGIPYDAPFGHRGAFHSVVMGLVLGIVAGLIGRGLGSRWVRTTLLALPVAVSHGLLDSLTDGGRGIAVFWPFTNERFFAPWQPIPVSPIGWAVLSEWGLRVMLTELVLFLPLFVYAFWPRRRTEGSQASVRQGARRAS